MPACMSCCDSLDVKPQDELLELHADCHHRRRPCVFPTLLHLHRRIRRCTPVLPMQSMLALYRENVSSARAGKGKGQTKCCLSDSYSLLCAPVLLLLLALSNAYTHLHREKGQTKCRLSDPYSLLCAPVLLLSLALSNAHLHSPCPVVYSGAWRHAGNG
jgi:hypothetical protein